MERFDASAFNLIGGQNIERFSAQPRPSSEHSLEKPSEDGVKDIPADK